MGLMEQPTAFFGGGYVIKGNVEVSGDLLQDPIRIGIGAETLSDTMAIGLNATATGDNSISIGGDSRALSINSTALGEGADALGVDATALGNEATAPSNWNTVVGYDAGSFNNGNNVVLIGRKSEGQGNDVVSIGENTRANADNATAVGKASSALGLNSSVFGQGSTALGDGVTVVGQDVSVSDDNATSIGTDVTVSAIGATGVGRGSIATGENATAVGNGAEANGANSVAIGTGSVADRDDIYSFGDRDVNLPLGRSLLYPEDAGSQTIVNIPVTDGPAAGTAQEYKFEVAGESILEIAAEADGVGGIQNKVARIRGSFDIRGGNDSLADIVSGDISIVDQEGTEQVGLDATSDPVVIDLHNNRVNNFGLRNGESITYAPDAGAQRLANINIDGASENSEESISLGINGNDIFKAYGEADGAGGINNLQLRLTQELNVNDYNIVDSVGGKTIWNASQNYIEQSALENSALTYISGEGLTGGGEVPLGSSATFNIGAGSFITTNADAIDVNIGSGLEDDGSDNIRIRGDSIADSFLSEGSSPHQLSVNIGSGLEGFNNNIRINGSDIADTFLSQGSNPYQLSVNIGRGLVGESDSITVDETTEFDFDNIITFQSGVDTRGDITDGTITIWNDSAGYINQDVLQNDTITVNAGNGLKNAGDVSLGNGLTIDIEPADFVGSFLSDEGSDLIGVNIGNGIEGDGADNIRVNGSSVADTFLSEGSSPHKVSVNISRGLEGDGANSIQIDEDTDFTFTSQIDFNAGLDVSSDIVQDVTVIWDSANSYIPQGRLENDTVSVAGNNVPLGGSISVDLQDLADFDINGLGDITDAGTVIWDTSGGYVPQTSLEHDSLTVDAGNALTGGGEISLNGSATVGIATDGIQLDEIDESISPTWSDSHTFSAGIAMGSQINMQSANSIINLPNPGSALEAANKQYVDGVASGLAVKEAVTVYADTNIDLTSTTDPNPIDGYTISDGDRVLLANQTDATENGIYTASTATDPSTWVRSSDADEDDEVNSGMFTFVENGDIHIDQGFTVTTQDPITLGTTEIEFSQFSGAGSIDVGDGLGRSGNILSTVVSDFAGTFISDDGSNNLTVDIDRGLENDGSGSIRLDEDTDFTFSSVIDFASGLDVQGSITDGTQNIWDSSAQEVPDSALGVISNTILDKNKITVTAGNALSGGGETQLGNEVSVAVDVIQNSDLSNSSLSVNAGNGVSTTGSSISLGGSSTLSIVPGDFAGTFISTDGSTPQNLTVDIGRGITNDGSGNISIDESTDFTFTSALDFSSGLDTSGNITDNGNGATIWDSANGEIPDSAMGSISNATLSNSAITINSGNGLTGGSTSSLGGSLTLGIGTGGVGINELDTPFTDLSTLVSSPVSVGAQLNLSADLVGSDGSTTVWDSTNNHIPTGALQFTDVTISGSDGLTGGTASLGGSVTVGISGNLSLDSGLQATDGEVIWDEANSYIPQSSLQNDSLSVAGNSVSLGGSIGIDLADLSSFDVSGNSLVDSGVTIWDSASGYVPTTSLQSDTVTVSTGTGISGGGDFSLGGSGLTISLTNTDITLNGQNGLTGGTVSLGGSVNVGVSGAFQLDTDLESNPGGTGVLIWDESNGYIPQGRLQNDTLTVAGNDVSLGGSVDVDFSDLSEFRILDDTPLEFGSNSDFQFEFDSNTDELVLRDNNGVELIRQPKAGPAQFIQGADIGSIEAPEDSFTQIVNASVTSALSSGDTVGYTFAVDNQSVIEVSAEADGSGGIQNTSVGINTLNDNGQGFIDFNVSGTKRAELDSSGNLDIEGELTEGAAL